MSLINKMLTDLETRKDLPAGAKVTKPIFADLRPAARIHGGRSRRALVNILLLTVCAGALFFAWQQWGAAWITDLQALQNRIAGRAPDKPAAEPKASPPADVAVATTPAPASAKETLVKAVEPKPAEAKPVPRAAAKSAPAAPRLPRAVILSAASADKTSVEKKDRPWTAEEQAENRYRKAGSYLKQKQRREAEAELQAALAADARHTPARELLVGLLLESGRSQPAQQLLEQGLSAAPEHTPFVQLLARLYVDQGADAQALALLEKHRTSGEQNAEYMALFATLYQRAGRHAESAAAYRQALGLRPQEGKWWAGLAISLEADKQWPSAYEAYARAQAAGLPPALDRYVEQRLAALKGRAK